MTRNASFSFAFLLEQTISNTLCFFTDSILMFLQPLTKAPDVSYFVQILQVITFLMPKIMVSNVTLVHVFCQDSWNVLSCFFLVLFAFGLMCPNFFWWWRVVTFQNPFHINEKDKNNRQKIQLLSATVIRINRNSVHFGLTINAKFIQIVDWLTNL